MFKRARLFSISVLPMWLLLFIKTINIPYYFGKDWQLVEWDEIITISNIVASVSAVLFVCSLYYCYLLCYRLKGTPSSLPVIIESCVKKDIDYINTLATLVTLFSVLMVEYESVRDLIILLLLLLIIYVCYTKTNLYYCNPVFAAFQFKIVEVQTGGNRRLPNGSIVLYRGNLKERVEPYHIADNIYIQAYD